MADRFYCPDPAADGRIVLRGDEARHLARVRRLGPGDSVEVFDGRSPDALRAEVRAVSGDRVELVVAGAPVPGREPAAELVLGVAVPKGERFDWLVEKAVEVGVARLVPLRAERSVVDPRPAKLNRQRRAVVEASKQCGRNRLMELEAPATLGEFLSRPAPTRRIAHPGGVPPASWPRPDPRGAILLAVGPEGGFTEAEVARAVELGWSPVALGPTVLRVETAALVAAALALAPLS